MTNTENTITTLQLADELDVTSDEVETAAFMLGISILWAYNDVQSARIRDWVNGNGGQTIGGGVY